MIDATKYARLRALGDYVFGRNGLLGLASLMLLVISGYATWHGMRDRGFECVGD